MGQPGFGERDQATEIEEEVGMLGGHSRNFKTIVKTRAEFCLGRLGRHPQLNDFQNESQKRNGSSVRQRKGK